MQWQTKKILSKKIPDQYYPAKLMKRGCMGFYGGTGVYGEGNEVDFFRLVFGNSSFPGQCSV